MTSETRECVLRFGGFEFVVGVRSRRFPNGGGWSSFLCPRCGVQVRVLRLLNGAVICCRCCVRSGIRYRIEDLGVRGRAALRIPRLRALLESEVPLRRSGHLWGKLEKRKRLEAALARCEHIVAEYDFSRRR